MPLPEDSTRTFETHRPRLVRLAYRRMLGSVAEAEDVVQDAWLRWQQADSAKVESAPAFLSRIVTRLCLDVMKSARVRREGLCRVVAAGAGHRGAGRRGRRRSHADADAGARTAVAAGARRIPAARRVRRSAG